MLSLQFMHCSIAAAWHSQHAFLTCANHGPLSMQRDAKVTRACRCVFTQCRNKVVVVVGAPISSYTHWSLRGISDCEVQVNVLRGLSVWLALSYVRRRRKGHGSEWLEADMGFNESSLHSFSQLLTSGEKKTKKGAWSFVWQTWTLATFTSSPTNTHTHTHSLQPVHGLCRGGAGAWTVCPKKHLLGSKRIH